MSSTLAEDNGQIFRITPAPRPPMWFMYAAVTFPVLGGLVAILAFHDGPDKWKWLSIIGILGPVAAILCLDLVSWLWKLEGTEDYIVVDRAAGEATLPRLGVAAPVSDITRLVETIHGENPNSVGLVIKNDVAALPDKQWVYAYVFSPYGRKDKFVPLLADALGVPVQQSNGSGNH